MIEVLLSSKNTPYVSVPHVMKKINGAVDVPVPHVMKGAEEAATLHVLKAVDVPVLPHVLKKTVE